MSPRRRRTTMSPPFPLLRDSLWEILQQGTTFADQFYQRLFATYPELQQLFAHTDMHAQHVRFLVALLNVLDDTNPADIAQALGNLRELGQRHQNYNVRPEQYTMVGEVLLITLEDFLGEQWTPEVAQAWTDAYGTMTQVLLTGYDQPDGAVPTDTPPRPSRFAWWLGLPAEAGPQN